MQEKEKEKQKPKPHNYILENRSKLILSGVHEVGSFNETEAVAYTAQGELRIKGKELQVVAVNVESGDMEITGKIYSSVYTDNTERIPNNFITRLFK
ncbi:MAG: sporulation protein YabP [Oscillospiraceae bacterium]|jgi:sporulation protein YabP|nr:sporulation protein YabP [Oscillospiraceae bacterium]